MPKSQIIRDLVDDKVTLAMSLNRLFVLASDVNNNQLAQWAEKELNGYKDIDELPEYRKVKNLILIYSGINGRLKVENVPLLLDWLSTETKDMISTIEISIGIQSISEFASGKETPNRDLTNLAGEVLRNTNGGVQCYLINQKIPKAFLQSILDSVKNKMIVALLELEKTYGILDSLGIDISDKRQGQLEVNNAELNRAVFNITMPSQEKKKEPWYSKVAWNIVIPIITAIVGAFIVKYFGL